MKNIPIVGKFVAILVIFGVFLLVTVAYATHGMRVVGGEYSQVMNGRQVLPTTSQEATGLSRMRGRAWTSCC